MTTAWNAFLSSLRRDNLEATIQLNDQVLQEAQATVLGYEELAGQKTLAAIARFTGPQENSLNVAHETAAD